MKWESVLHDRSAVAMSKTKDLWGQYAEEAKQLAKESERGVAIIAAAYLDEQLHQLIANFLVDDEKEVDELLGGDTCFGSALGSFDSRIRAAYCLGLISRDEYYDLKIIKKIRNQFAHRLHGVSFEDQSIGVQCNSLKGFFEEWLPLQADHISVPRFKYQFVALWHLMNLADRTQRIERMRQVVWSPSKAEAIYSE
jgi:DNA-binding MltR family transcriptional regulator